MSIKELRSKLHEFGIINIVGNKAVQVALDEGVVSDENVIEIAKVKHGFRDDNVIYVNNNKEQKKRQAERYIGRSIFRNGLRAA